MRLSPVDLTIVVAYLIGITLFGIRFRKEQHNLRDYFLAGGTAFDPRTHPGRYSALRRHEERILTSLYRHAILRTR